jgi:hypothetical protein
MILGIAAVILIVLWNFFPGIRKWVSGFIKKIVGIKIGTESDAPVAD